MEGELQKNGLKVLDQKGAEILLAIKETSSITLSTKRTGLSYKGLWEHIRQLEEGLGRQLVQTVSGGRKGGASSLTLMGESILEDYLILASRVKHFLETHAASPPDITIVGSYCPVLELLVTLIRRKYPQIAVKLINAGSFRGLASIRLRLADIAGVHIADKRTGAYNLPAMRDLGLLRSAVLVRGYERAQGLIVEKDNPKSIRGLTDILRNGLVFINRNQGSGTRRLFELKTGQRAEEGRSISRLQRSDSRIREYRLEARSHEETALAVAQGRANAGFGLQCIAVKHNLGFIPVAHELYDFIVRKDRLENPQVNTFIRELQSKEFRELVTKSLPEGIGFLPDTGRIVAQ